MNRLFGFITMLIIVCVAMLAIPVGAVTTAPDPVVSALDSALGVHLLHHTAVIVAILAPTDCIYMTWKMVVSPTGAGTSLAMSGIGGPLKYPHLIPG